MKKNIVIILGFCAAVGLSACGGGGGGGTPAPVTKAVTKVYLFGTMSSNSRIATVQTRMVIPTGVMVNYTSPTGATSGTYPLRKGVIVPSGPVLLSSADFTSSTYTIESRTLMINVINQSRLALASSNTGNGAEIATINLPLTTPGATVSMPLQDLLVTVGQERTPISLDYLTGCMTNFVTNYL